jgi:hypothetical protein
LNDTTPLGTTDATQPATEGSGFFYLLRAVNCGGGTYDSGGPKQATPRDAKIAASPFACP